MTTNVGIDMTTHVAMGPNGPTGPNGLASFKMNYVSPVSRAFCIISFSVIFYFLAKAFWELPEAPRSPQKLPIAPREIPIDSQELAGAPRERPESFQELTRTTKTIKMLTTHVPAVKSEKRLKTHVPAHKNERTV